MQNKENTQPGSVFEIVDNTGEENYWTLGMFPTLPDAIAALEGCTPENMPGDTIHDYECEAECRIEIREHKYGWGGTGKCVHTVRWVSRWDEEADSLKWDIQPKGETNEG